MWLWKRVEELWGSSEAFDRLGFSTDRPQTIRGNFRWFSTEVVDEALNGSIDLGFLRP